MANENSTSIDTVDCACVIHGIGYSWTYVDRLSESVARHFGRPVRFHVYTEPRRSVPGHMIKHDLVEWKGVSGPRKSWWYKMQLFNAEHHQGNLLYFDLDVVIVNELNWILDSDPNYFWTLRDFRYLQKPTQCVMNSSVMYWNVPRFDWVWQDFQKLDIVGTTHRFPGDQDYLQQAISNKQRRLWDDWHFQSWRWQCIDGGYDFRTRRHRAPGTGAAVDPRTSVVVFHGNPKPHEVTDPVVQAHWR